MLAAIRFHLHQRIGNWALLRHGMDSDPTTVSGRRIYILPTRLGLMYAMAVCAMGIGAMNYANNLALGLAFVLGSLGFVAMHHCHRNLAGLRVAVASTAPVFAGQSAIFKLALENDSSLPRFEILAGETDTAARLSGRGRVLLRLEKTSIRRGWLPLDRFELSTRYPFGLFRAWTVLHMDHRCLVYPRPSPPGDAPPPFETDIGSAQDERAGEEDFAGFRSFQAGDSPRRIAWKAYARGEELLVKQYAGTAVTSHFFDWDGLPGLDAEARLSRLCRWVLEAHAAGRAYGLRLPGASIEPNLGPAHRERCLAALALFDDSRSRRDSP